MPNTGLACTCLHVYLDKDKNGKYTNSADDGIANVPVTIVDSQGNTHHLKTDLSGYLFAVLPLGEVTVTIDENDSSLANLTFKEGADKNPVTVINTDGQTHIGNYGFVD